MRARSRPHKLKLKKKPSLKKGVSKTHSKMDDPSLELLISDMTVHIGTYTVGIPQRTEKYQIWLLFQKTCSILPLI